MKNFKKVLALVLVLATLLGLATMASATEYKDADKINADYTEAIKVLDLIETMQGYPDGSFKPTATITREEAAKVIAIFDNKDADISTYYTSINPFTDEKGRWGESYVGYGYRAGIIAGMNATTYAPTTNVTGTQFLKMALVTLGYDQEKEGFVGASWAVNVLALAKKIGLIDNLADGWKPEHDLTREEAAQILLNTLEADTVEYAQEAKSADFKPTSKNGVWIFKGKLYLTVAGAVKTGSPLYKDFDLEKTTTTDAFYRPYTTWKLGKNTVDVMDAPKATFTKKFSACDLLVALGVPESDVKTNIIIDAVYCDGQDVDATHSLINDGEPYDFYWTAEDEEADITGLNYESAVEWKHTTSVCDSKDTKHGAQGVLTQVFYNGKDADGNKHYTVTSIETWLGKVTSVTEKATARDKHLKSEGAVELEAYFTSEQTVRENNCAYCEFPGDDENSGHCELLEEIYKLDDNVLTFNDPTGLKKNDYVLFTYSFRQIADDGKDYTEGGVQTVDVTEGKDGRLGGYKYGASAGSDPSQTRVDGEYIKDSQHFHMGYDLSKTNEYGTYTFFYDAYGNVIGMKEAADASTWGVIDLAYITFEKGEAQLNADIVDLDAKTTSSTIKKFADIYDIYDEASDTLPYAVGNKEFAYNLAKALFEKTNGEGKQDFNVIYDHLYKTSTDKDGKYTVKVGVDADGNSLVDAYGVHPYDYDSTTYTLSDYTIKVVNNKPYLEVSDDAATEYNGKAEGTEIALTSNTKFLVHKMDGTYVAYTGYKNVPSMIAHYAEVVYDADYTDELVADVVYLTHDVYMTDSKVTAYVGNGADRSNIEVVEDGDTYYGLDIYVKGEKSTVYVTEEDMQTYFTKSDVAPATETFVAGFYQLQYTDVDGVTTVKVLKVPADFDEFMREPVAADYFNGTVIKLTDSSNEAKTYALTDDCGLYGIYKGDVETVKASEIESLYSKTKDGSTDHYVYVELNSDDEVTAIYINLANND